MGFFFLLETKLLALPAAAEVYIVFFGNVWVGRFCLPEMKAILKSEHRTRERKAVCCLCNQCP